MAHANSWMCCPERPLDNPAYADEVDPPEAETTPAASPEWVEDCLKWRGKVLTGKYGHWCYDWDGLPIDETCPEWPCACAKELEAGR